MKIRNKKIICLGLCIFLFLVSVFFVFGSSVFAQTTPIELPDSDYANTNLDIFSTVTKLINYAMSFLGFIAVILILYGGFIWMTAKGDDKKVEKAKKIIKNTVIGLVIIFAAWGIVRFIFGLFNNNNNGSCVVCSDEGFTDTCFPTCAEGMIATSGVWTCEGGCFGACSGTCERGYEPEPVYGDFALQWHYPKSNAENVSLCSMISARFNHLLGTGNTDKIKVYRCADETCLAATRSELTGNVVVNQKIISFYPGADYAPNTFYKVEISSEITDNAGDSLGSEEDWQFKTGTLSDDTAPTVANKYPTGSDVCLKSVIQAEFSESMDPNTLENLANFNLEATGGDIPEFSAYTPESNFVTFKPKSNYSPQKNYTSQLMGSVITRADWDRSDTTKGMRDVCGNPLAPPSYDWNFETGDNAYCDPEITSITPSVYHDGEMTIAGYYFTIGGNIKLEHELFAGSNCFKKIGDYYFPQNECLLSWTDNSITLKIPGGGGVSNGPVNGPVNVVISGDDEDPLVATSDTVEILSPHVNTVSGYNNSVSSSFADYTGGASGGAGQIITLSGMNFGSTAGVINFINTSTREVISSAELPELCRDRAWTPTNVAAVVPAGFEIGDKLKIQIIIASGGSTEFNRASNLIAFNYTNEVGPGICGASFECPDGNCGGISSDSGSIFGRGFETTAEQLFFGVKEVLNKAGITPSLEDEDSYGYSAWGDERIDTYVPFGIFAGSNPIKILRGEISSNIWPFQAPCNRMACDGNITTPTCDVNNGMCLLGYTCNSDSCTCEKEFRITNKYPTCNEACINTAIQVNFSHEVDEATLTTSNINFIPAIDFTTSYADDETGNILIINPTEALNQSTEYRVILKSEIKNTEGKFLAGLNYDSNTDGINDSYSWTFKTKNSSNRCVVDSVSILGLSRIQVDQTKPYDSRLGSPQNCSGTPINSALDLDIYSYNWTEIGDESILSITNQIRPSCNVNGESAGDTILKLRFKPIDEPAIEVQKNISVFDASGGDDPRPGERCADTCGPEGRCARGSACNDACLCEGTSVEGDPCGDGACEGDGTCGSDLTCNPDTCRCVRDSLLESLSIFSIDTPKFCTNGLIVVTFNNSIEGFCSYNTELGSWSSDFNFGSYSIKSCSGKKITLGGDFARAETYTVNVTRGGESILPSTINPKTFSMDSTATRCYLDEVKIDPEESEFYKRDQELPFSAIPYASNGEAIRITGGYAAAATVAWNLNPADLLVLTSTNTTILPTTISLKTPADDTAKNGSAKLQVSAVDYDEDGVLIYKYGTADIDVNLCENRGLFKVGSVEDNSFTDTALLSNNNFELRYCLDNNPNFPTVLKVVQGPPFQDLDADPDTRPLLNKHYLFTDNSGSKKGTIGLVVFQNLSYKNLETWFANKFDNYFSGSKTTVDGYPAIVDGRSTYVAATNINQIPAVPPSTTPTYEKYINVYLFSYDEEVDSALYKELINNWTFNTNSGGIVIDKIVLARDMTRVLDLAYIRNLLENYKTAKGTYPSLGMDASRGDSSGDGVYKIGESTSLWTSWKSVFGQELAKANSNVSMPVDPTNKLGIVNGATCTTSSECSSGLMQCYQGHCLNIGIGYSPTTGWNSFAQKYACPDGSYFYAYKATSGGAGYSLMANMESDFGGWNTFITNPLNSCESW
ncbi:MAG: Ig-like domain-containing protein [Patescibacteria group bacterium]